jgi:hypothetical protein
LTKVKIFGILYKMNNTINQQIEKIGEFWGIDNLTVIATTFSASNIKMMPTSRGCAFTAVLKHKGVKVADFENAGRGGCTTIDWDAKDTPAQVEFEKLAGDDADDVFECLMEIAELK